jgi:hypothetical protein
MTAREKAEFAGYEDIMLFANYSYDDAFIGVSEDGRAVYDYAKMVEWLMKEENWTEEEAVEWIDYNAIRSIPYWGDEAPIIMYPIDFIC